MRLTVMSTLLAFCAGSVDVASFTRLGEVFSSVMTGNLVLLGLAASNGSAHLAVSTAVAFAGYIAGAAAGSLLSRPSGPPGSVWPGRVTVTLLVELAVLGGLAVGWVRTDARPTGAVQLGLLGLAALAMGLQSAAVRRLGTETPMSTTYLTDTLTGVVAALVGPRSERRVDTRGVTTLGAVAAGAGAGGALVVVWPVGVPMLALGSLGLVIAFAAAHHLRQRRAA